MTRWDTGEMYRPMNELLTHGVSEMATAFSAKQETMRNFGGYLYRKGVSFESVGPLPGENGVRVVFRAKTDADHLGTSILRIIEAFALLREDQPWKPDVCRIVARSIDEDGGATWVVKSDWLPEEPLHEADEQESQAMLDRVTDTMEAF